MYLIVKHSHLTLMVISVVFLINRVLATTNNAQWLQRKWAKISPHVIDTFLLISAIMLMVIIGQYPIADPWLSAKLLALVGYIGFGTLAIKGDKSTLKRLAFLLIALTFIGFMIVVAITKNPFPWML